jgi:hypothetical protein
MKQTSLDKPAKAVASLGAALGGLGGSAAKAAEAYAKLATVAAEKKVPHDQP